MLFYDFKCFLVVILAQLSVSVSVKKKSAKTGSLAEKKLVSAGATVELASLAPAPLQLRPQAKFAPLFSSPLS